MGNKVIKIYLVHVFVGFLIVLLAILFFENKTYKNFNYDTENFVFDNIITNDDTTILTSIIKKDSNMNHAIGFFTVHQDVEVSINDKIVYSFEAGNNLFGKTNGVAWHVIQIECSCELSEIKVELSSPYKSNIGKIPEFLAGDILSVYVSVLVNNGTSFLVCIIVFLIGVCILTFYLFTKTVLKNDVKLLTLAIFSIIFSLWSVNETHIMTLIFRNHVFLSYFAFVSFSLLPVPFLMVLYNLFDERMNNPKREIVWKILLTISFSNIFFTWLLQIFDILDFRETVIITHSIMGVFIIFTIGLTIRSLIKNNLDNSMRFNYIAIFILAILSIIDIVSYYNGAFDVNRYGRYGYLIYIVTLGVTTVKKSVYLMGKGKEAEIYSKLAFLDVLTGMNNRNSFTQAISNIDYYNTKTAIIMFDINNLKECNDRYGHESGDKYIKKVVEIINKTFTDSYGKYRIGGDEFCVIIQGKDEITVQKYIENFEELEENAGVNACGKLISVAKGYAFYDKKIDEDINSTIRRADNKMYENKAFLKRNTSI